MVQDVLVPQMGESVLEGTILEWKVKIGDKVKNNQALVELMTDKVNVEIPAETDGILTGQFAKEGDVVPVGTRIATIDDGKGDSAGATPKAAPAAEKPASTPAAEAPSAAKSAPTATATAVAAPSAGVEATGEVGRGKLSPKMRMMIREYGVDPTTILPTGKKGLVTADDVMRAVEGRSAAAGFTVSPTPLAMPAAVAPAVPATPAAAQVAAAPAAPKVQVNIPAFEQLPSSMRETRMPLAGARKAISDHMSHSLHTAAHVTTFEEIDFTELAAFRREVKKSFIETYGVNVTYMPFVIKAVCVALKEFPTVNASMTEQEIILKNYYNIGIAVARDEGLIVPVIKDADKKTIVELAYEITELGEKARTNRLMPDDVANGTFTVTNAGMFGATASTPVIAQPQVAILGVHAIAKRPWVIDDEIKIREISSFGLSFDHRLIDGHTGVQFLHRINEYLSSTNKLLMNLR